MSNFNSRREQLINRQVEISDKLREIEGDLDAPVNKDVEDRSVEREDDEILEAVGNSGLKEIRMIEAALLRIDEGTYGNCQKCGSEISSARLDLLPHTPFCRNCAV